jgi:hypothetical protein
MVATIPDKPPFTNGAKQLTKYLKFRNESLIFMRLVEISIVA